LIRAYHQRALQALETLHVDAPRLEALRSVADKLMGRKH
jgi:geranylgeranyl pyrophosphate synthase